MIRRGFIIEFKRGKFWSISGILGNILKLFERDWDGWGWHLGIAWEQAYDGWNIFEATDRGVQINYYSNDYLAENTRAYQWLDKVPTRKAMGEFLKTHIGKRYDVAFYFLTTAQYLIRHFVHISMPLVLDNRYACWEIADEFCDTFGKPWAPKYGFPLITDFLKAVTNRV